MEIQTSEYIHFLKCFESGSFGTQSFAKAFYDNFRLDLIKPHTNILRDLWNADRTAAMKLIFNNFTFINDLSN